jgi:hypothetical protein
MGRVLVPNHGANASFFVTAELGPPIHGSQYGTHRSLVDGRAKPGHDDLSG